MRKLGTLARPPSPIPGLVLAVVVMLASLALSGVLGRLLFQLQRAGNAEGTSPVSAAALAVLLGILLGNTLPFRDRLRPGVRVGTTAILRAGIVAVGIKLSVMDILRLGATGLPVVLAAIVSGLVFVPWLNRRLGLPERLGTLLAAGTSICGVTAVVSTAGAIDADEKEVSYAVANVTLFGLVGMLAYPALAHALFDASAGVGLFLGTAIHDTSQVVGAAVAYRQLYHDPLALEVATVTKLTRNLFLAAVVPLLALYHARGGGRTGTRVPWTKAFPFFIVGFLVMATVRSVGDMTLADGRAFGLLDERTWQLLTTAIGDTWGARIVLGTALASVGINTRLSVFREIGGRPFVVGLAGAVWVGLVGFVVARLVTP